MATMAAGSIRENIDWDAAIHPRELSRGAVVCPPGGSVEMLNDGGHVLHYAPKAKPRRRMNLRDRIELHIYRRETDAIPTEDLRDAALTPVGYEIRERERELAAMRRKRMEATAREDLDGGVGDHSAVRAYPRMLEHRLDEAERAAKMRASRIVADYDHAVPILKTAEQLQAERDAERLAREESYSRTWAASVYRGPMATGAVHYGRIHW